MSYDQSWNLGSSSPAGTHTGDDSFYTFLPIDLSPPPSTNAPYAETPYYNFPTQNFSQNSSVWYPYNQPVSSHQWDGRESSTSGFLAGQDVQYPPSPGRLNQQGYVYDPSEPIQLPPGFEFEILPPPNDTNYTDTIPPCSMQEDGFPKSESSLASVPLTAASLSMNQPSLAPPAFEKITNNLVEYKLILRFTEPRQNGVVMEYLDGNSASRPYRSVRVGRNSGRKYYTDEFLNHCVVIMDGVITTQKHGTKLTGLWEFERKSDGFLQEAVVFSLASEQVVHWYIILSPYPAGTIRGLLGLGSRGKHSNTRGGVKQKLPPLLPKQF
jgi:hypothetical protein